MHGSIRIGTKIETKKFDEQIKYLDKQIKEKEEENIEIKAFLENNNFNSLKKELSDLEKEIDSLNNKKINLDSKQNLTNSEIKELNFTIDTIREREREIERLKKAINSLPQKYELQIKNNIDIEKMKNQVVDLSKKAKNANVNLNKMNVQNLSENFNKNFTSAKKLIGTLISIRGMYSLLSKASQSYLATDEKTTKSMQSNWIGLGAILEPAIKMVSELLRKATTSILYFMSCLTGTNYIAKANNAIIKANTKEIEKNTKAKKENQTYSFDEMDIIQSQDNSSSSSNNNELMPLFSLSDIGSGAKRSIEEIAKALKPVYDFVKDIVGFAIEHPGLIIGILGGVKLVSFLKQVLGGNDSGLFGIKSTLLWLGGALAVKSIITNIGEIKDAYDDATKAIESGKKIFEERQGNVEHDIQVTKKQAYETEKGTKKIEELNDEIKKNSKYNLDMAKAVQKSKSETGFFQGIAESVLGTTGRLNENIAAYIENAIDYANSMGVLYRQGKLNEEETEEYKNLLKDLDEALNGTSEESYALRRSFKEAEDGTNRLKSAQLNLSEQIRNTEGKISNAQIITDAFRNALLKVPKNNVIKVDTKQIDNAKGKVSNLVTDLANLAKKTITSNVTLNFKSIGDFANSTVAIAADTIKQLLATTTTKKYAAAGAIINNPGRGVPVTSEVIGGEQGTETVLPLTDPSAMAQVGREIGKNVRVSFTNITKLDSRTISREQKEVENEDGFANNWR